MVQLAREAFAVSGIQMDLSFFPWSRAENLSRMGDRDGTIAYSHTAERQKYYNYSDAIYRGTYALFHLKDTTLNWKQLSDLKNIRIAATRGFGGMGNAFLEAEKKGELDVLRLTSSEQCFSMLLNKRVQAVPIDLEAGYALLRAYFGEKAILFTHSSHYLNQPTYHLVISKKNKRGPEIIRKFNEGLAHLHKSGRYTEIVKFWYRQPIYKNALPASYLQQRLQQPIID